MTMPLEGYRVLDFTIWQHGAYGTTMLADLGAEVIKVEEPKSGDHARWYISQSPDGFNSYFQAHNRGKKSITVNLKHPKGQEVIYNLVKRVDVVTENYTYGVMDRQGLGYDVLCQHNPRIIYASATGFGPRGPYAHWRSMDAVFQGYGGAMVAQGGGPGNRPEPVAIPHGDQVGAIIFSHAIVAALLARERTGEGQRVFTSGIGSQITLQAWRITATLRHGAERRTIPHGRFGTSPTWHYYQDSQGQWFTLGLMAHQGWPAFCRAIGREDLIEDPRFAELRARLGNQELEDLLTELLKTRTREEWLQLLQDQGIPCGPIHSYEALVNDPQVLANDYITTIEDPHWGTMRTPGVTMQFSKTPARPTRGAPELGEHTEEVLTELAGYTWEELAQLREEGAI